MLATAINTYVDIEQQSQPVTASVISVKHNIFSAQQYADWFQAFATSDTWELERRASLSILGEVASLESNWDAYGAKTIADETYRNSERFLTSLSKGTPLPTIIPNPNGTISLQWEDDYRFAHLEIGKTGYSFYALFENLCLAKKEGEVTSLDKEIEASIQAVFSIDKTPSHQISRLDYL